MTHPTLAPFPSAVVLGFYPGCGWIAIGLRDGQEVYRGEYHPTAEAALEEFRAPQEPAK